MIYHYYYNDKMCDWNPTGFKYIGTVKRNIFHQHFTYPYSGRGRILPFLILYMYLEMIHVGTQGSIPPKIYCLMSIKKNLIPVLTFLIEMRDQDKIMLNLLRAKREYRPF